jgi:rubrerythrin
MNKNQQKTDNPGNSQKTISDPSANLTSKLNPEGLASQWRRTKCMVCGYIHEGQKVLKKCPKCGNTDPDKFRETD